MAAVADWIRLHEAEILESWTREAGRAAAARGLDRPELQNIMPVYLRSLATAGDELGRFTSERREYVASHFASRLRQGFLLAEIVAEFGMLGRCIAGTWILVADQEQLFRPFLRSQAAQAGGQRGWGLGLTLVHGAAIAHGGRVTVESTPEAGTTFALELPLDARAARAARAV